MTNRYEYIGTEAGAILMVDSNGMKELFSCDSNPYIDKGDFYASLGTTCDRFSFDQFINNVELPWWMSIKGTVEDSGEGYVINPVTSIYWYDSSHDVWITTAENMMYHIFK